MVRTAVTGSPASVSSLLNVRHVAASVGKFCNQRSAAHRQFSRDVANELSVNQIETTRSNDKRASYVSRKESLMRPLHRRVQVCASSMNTLRIPTTVVATLLLDGSISVPLNFDVRREHRLALSVIRIRILLRRRPRTTLRVRCENDTRGEALGLPGGGCFGCGCGERRRYGRLSVRASDRKSWGGSHRPCRSRRPWDGGTSVARLRASLRG